MIGLDTNILVRYITRDDSTQYEKAKGFIESKCTADHPGYISVVVLCELVWVLKSAYGATKQEITGVVERLIVTKQLQVEEREAVRQALQEYLGSISEFADCLIGILNGQAGCKTTATFDRKAARLETFSETFSLI